MTFEVIKCNNAYNMRTIGGMKTPDGLTVRKYILFRSDNLAYLSNDDLDRLNLFSIKKIVDFRSQDEKTKEPDVLPENASYMELPIEADKKIKEELVSILNGTLKRDMSEFLVEANRDFVTNYSHVFSKFIKDFIKYAKPTLFHCTSGKDRTGFASALILFILGVEREDVLTEYLFSNECIERTIDKQYEKISTALSISIEDCKKMDCLLKVQIKYIEAALDKIDELYGNMDNYIKNGLELTSGEIEQLRRIMLY
jgi:protein-tyrosine phosphatase